MFLARDGSRIVGRNLVYIDHTFNRYYDERIGFFGAFEAAAGTAGVDTVGTAGLDAAGTAGVDTVGTAGLCTVGGGRGATEEELGANPAVAPRNDGDRTAGVEAAAALLEAGEAWLRERGMRAVRGQIHLMAENWGFQIEGGSVPPIFMSSYNPPEYVRFLESRGYGKAKDLLVYAADSAAGYVIPKRFISFAERMAVKRPNIRVRAIRPRSLSEDGEHIWRISNIAYADNWGYVPVDKGVLQEMIHKLKPLIDPDAIWFVEDNGNPVGYCLGFPDLNVVLRKIEGRLFPFGFISLLAGIPKITNYRLFGLALLPEYHGMGLDVLLYVTLYKALSARKIRLEANYILEDNLMIRNALEKLALEHVKTYRVFEKPLT